MHEECVLCRQPEEAHNFATGHREPVKTGPDVRAITCSRCVQRLLAADTEGLQRLYDKGACEGNPRPSQRSYDFFTRKRRHRKCPRSQRQ